MKRVRLKCKLIDVTGTVGEAGSVLHVLREFDVNRGQKRFCLGVNGTILLPQVEAEDCEVVQ